MIKIIKFFLLLLPKSHLSKLYYLLFLVFIGSFLEILSFGSFIPILDIVLNQKNTLLNNFESLNIFLNNNNEIEKFFYIALFLLVIFSFKNFYLIFLTYFVSKFTNNLRLYYNQLYLREIYLKPFLFHLNNDSSKIIRDNLGEINAITKNLIFPTIIIILDFITFLGLIFFLIFNDPIITSIIIFFLILFSIIYVFFLRISWTSMVKTELLENTKKFKLF